MRTTITTTVTALVALVLSARVAQSMSEGSPVLKTGQTTCYESGGAVIGCAGTGQDGELQYGVARSFTDNGDGTITDNVTGLMWEKLADDGSVHGYDNAYTWTDAFSVKIAALNAESFAGYGDWRLPNIREFETLSNFGADSPATYSPFSTGCEPGCTVLTCSCTHPGTYHYWASTTQEFYPSMAWAMVFDGGTTLSSEKWRSWGVRAVRAGSSVLKTGQTTCYGENGGVLDCTGTGQDGEFQKGVNRSFVDNGDGTITDTVTGLMWEKHSDDGTINDKDNTYTWADAFGTKIATLNAEEFAGHGDWRLPNTRELYSLSNLGTHDPAVYSEFYTSCEPGCTVLTCSCTRWIGADPLPQWYWYWASTTWVGNPTHAWGTHPVSGSEQPAEENRSPSYLYGVRAVRSVDTLCGNGILDAGEACDDGNTANRDCCSDTCQFEASTTECRGAVGECDLAEYCTGGSVTCPADAKSTAECRASAGDCDIAESCDGASNDCPADGFVGGYAWSPTGSMGTARYWHTSSLLADGLVLVSGGASDANWLARSSAELYDPLLGTWSPTGPMGTARLSHTATVLPDGRVLVNGGYDGSDLVDSAEIYNPALGTWSPTGSMQTLRYNHTATLLLDGRVLVSGGDNAGGYLASAEIYDPVLGTWSPTGSMNSVRSVATATLLPDGRVLVSGGGYTNGGYLASAEIYDPALGTWSLTDSMSIARMYHTATLLPDGRVLVSGGWHTYRGSALASAEIYDPALGTWSLTDSMDTARWIHEATLLPDGRVLVSGGILIDYPPPLSTWASAEIYDPALGTWSATGSMGTPRYAHTATLLPDGRVLVNGGTNDSETVASAELFSPQALCRASAGDCDTAEYCTGSSAMCPVDAFTAPSTRCRASAGECDTADNCTGSSAACPDDAKSTALCRGAEGVCDTAEFCDGVANACPADSKSTAECRGSAGDCDIAENCDGSSNDCPADGFASSSTACRSSAGACDMAESCTGNSATCPADAKNTTECRASAGDCDIADNCDGVGNDCPADAKSTAECRASVGECDVSENCDGIANDCPADAFEPSTTGCAADINPCTDDHCDGAGMCAHPANTVPCDDGDQCTLDDRCTGTICVGQDVIVKPACEWVIMGGEGQDPDRPKRVGGRIRENATVIGDVCGDTVRVGNNSFVTGDIVATRSECSASAGIELGPNEAGVQDVDNVIVTGGASIVGKPRLTPLEGYGVGSNVTAIDCNVQVEPPSAPPAYYDTTGNDPLIAKCSSSRQTLADYVNNLDAPGTCTATIKPELGSIPAAGVLQIGPGHPEILDSGSIVEGQVNYLCLDGPLTSATDSRIEIDDNGDTATQYALIVTGKIKLLLRSQVALVAPLDASRLLIYGKSKCKIGDGVEGAGTLVCPNSKLLSGLAVTWNGALLSGKGYVQVGDNTVVTHVPLMFTEQ